MTCTLPCTIEKQRPPPRLIPILLTTVLAFVTWSPLSRVHGSSQAQGPPKRMDAALSHACRHAFLTGARPPSPGSASKTPVPTDYCAHPYLPQACSSRVPERAAIQGPSHKLQPRREVSIWPNGHGRYSISTWFWLERRCWAGNHWPCSRKFV